MLQEGRVQRHFRVARVNTKPSESGFPEFAVRRETISRFFEPPMPRSTFHDLVNKGRIIPLKELRGYYLLNESLRRLGLREVANLPTQVSERSMEDILRLAFHLIDPRVFPLPGWVLMQEELSYRDIDHAKEHANQHRVAVSELQSAEEKIAYMEGAIDAHSDNARETTAR